MSSQTELAGKSAMKRSKDKSKKSKKSAKEVEGNVNDREASTESSWTYKPPTGSVLLKHDVDNEEFDWDAVKDDDDLEIWVMRVPDGVRPRSVS